MRSRNRMAKKVSAGWNMKKGPNIGFEIFRSDVEMKQAPPLPPPPELLLELVLELALELQTEMAESII